jgi:hypothetical protein
LQAASTMSHITLINQSHLIKFRGTRFSTRSPLTMQPSFHYPYVADRPKKANHHIPSSPPLSAHLQPTSPYFYGNTIPSNSNWLEDVVLPRRYILSLHWDLPSPVHGALLSSNEAIDLFNWVVCCSWCCRMWPCPILPTSFIALHLSYDAPFALAFITFSTYLVNIYLYWFISSFLAGIPSKKVPASVNFICYIEHIPKGMCLIGTC